MTDKMDLHTHTLASGHAYNTLTEMAQAALEKGLELYGITEHAPLMPGACHEYYFSNLKVVPRQMSGLRLLLGVELNICDYQGGVDLPEPILKEMDLCIASIHLPCYPVGSAKENTRAYLGAMENPYIQIIGHPDDGRVPVDMEILAREAANRKVLLELNNSSLRPDGFRKNTWENATRMLKACEKYGTMIVMNSDAHVASEVGDHTHTKRLIEELRFPEELIINQDVEKMLNF